MVALIIAVTGKRKVNAILRKNVPTLTSSGDCNARNSQYARKSSGPDLERNAIAVSFNFRVIGYRLHQNEPIREWFWTKSPGPGKILIMRKIFLCFLVLAVSLPNVGCTKFKNFFGNAKEISPEEVVKQFIDLSAGSKMDSDRIKLQNLCSGEMRRAFERMTTEAYRISYLNSNVKILEVKILDSDISGESAKVHYQVTIDNRQGTDATKEINERVVELVKNQGAWYIDAIRLEGSDKVAFTRGMIF
jgi:hypothetical protein